MKWILYTLPPILLLVLQMQCGVILARIVMPDAGCANHEYRGISTAPCIPGQLRWLGHTVKAPEPPPSLLVIDATLSPDCHFKYLTLNFDYPDMHDRPFVETTPFRMQVSTLIRSGSVHNVWLGTRPSTATTDIGPAEVAPCNVYVIRTVSAENCALTASFAPLRNDPAALARLLKELPPECSMDQK